MLVPVLVLVPVLMLVPVLGARSCKECGFVSGPLVQLQTLQLPLKEWNDTHAIRSIEEGQCSIDPQDTQPPGTPHRPCCRTAPLHCLRTTLARGQPGLGAERARSSRSPRAARPTGWVRRGAAGLAKKVRSAEELEGLTCDECCKKHGEELGLPENFVRNRKQIVLRRV